MGLKPVMARILEDKLVKALKEQDGTEHYFAGLHVLQLTPQYASLQQLYAVKMMAEMHLYILEQQH